MQAEFIFDDVCNTLLSPPTACLRYVSSEAAVEVREVSSEWATLLFVVTVSVVLFSLIVYCRLSSSWHTADT